MSLIGTLTDIASVRSQVDTDKPVMFDTETCGFYGKIRLAQFFQRGWERPLLVEWPNSMELVSLLDDIHFVCHNVHYDITTVQSNIGKLSWIPERCDCTFLLSRLFYYMKEGFALDDCITYAVGTDVYSDSGIVKKDMQNENWNVPVLSQEQLTYASFDVIYMHDVWDQVQEMREDLNYKLDMLCLRDCLDFQNNGLPVDYDKLQAKYQANAERVKELNVPINVNSWQQVRPYINHNQSDDLALAMQAHLGNEKAEAVREARGLLKENSFLTKFANTMQDDRIYGKFKPSARSGRTTSNDQNLQQLPRSLKGIFGLPEAGDEVLIFTDFAQIQLRAVSCVANDKTLDRLFREGADLHNYVAEMIFGKDFTKVQRQICKTANFGLLFGAGIQVFKNILLTEAGLYLTDDEAMALKKQWLKLFKEVAEWQTKGIKAWKQKQIWQTPLGRRYTAKMMTDQLAMQIQGMEAEVAKLAAHYMKPKLIELCPDIRKVTFVHDSYIFQAPNDPDVFKPACIIIADAMQEAWAEISEATAITDLPMPVDVRVGFNWGGIEEKNFIYQYKQ